MSERAARYRGTWKKWLGIHLAVGTVGYLIVFLAFFHHGGGAGGGGFHY